MIPPVVNVIITTYDPGNYSRFKLLLEVLQSLKANLHYPKLRWIIADDGSDNLPEPTIREILAGSPLLFTNAQRSGVGRSKNIALQEAFNVSPYVLLLEDDWVLKEPLHLGNHVEVLRDNEDVGMIRFGFLGGQMEATYTDYGFPKTYWTLKHKSGHYVYSGQVSLRHKRFYDLVGYHVERNREGNPIEAGIEEDEMCHRYNNTTTVPNILWPAEYGTVLNTGAFINIGMDVSVNAVKP